MDLNDKIKHMECEIRRNSDVSQTHTMSSKDVKIGSKAAENGSANNELLQFFLGFLLLGGGIYWVLNAFEVTSSWGMGYYSFFGMRITGGIMLIPLLVGIGLLFFLDKKIIGGCVASLGLLVILISLLSSVSFHARYNTLYAYVLMFGMIAAGAGLLVKVLFKKKDTQK